MSRLSPEEKIARRKEANRKYYEKTYKPKVSEEKQKVGRKLLPRCEHCGSKIKTQN